MVTKLRIGDANTMMAEGGIQAADKENDSPVQHYLDAFGGGHFAARPELLRRLVMEAPDAIQWLNKLGVMFDKDEDGRMVTKSKDGFDAQAELDNGALHVWDFGPILLNEDGSAIKDFSHRKGISKRIKAIRFIYRCAPFTHRYCAH